MLDKGGSESLNYAAVQVVVCPEPSVTLFSGPHLSETCVEDVTMWVNFVLTITRMNLPMEGNSTLGRYTEQKVYLCK